MACDNCYNGCPNTVPDRCVKYTGENIPTLFITTGDPLSSVLNEFVIAILDVMAGKNIHPAYDAGAICALIEDNLPCCDAINLNDIITAIFKAICNLDVRVTELRTEVDAINADYTVDCLEGVTADAGAHAIVQAIIDKLCLTATDLEALILDVNTNYVKKSEINDIIAQYLEDIPTANKHYLKMIPYSLVAYDGPLNNFDATGAGTGDWEKVYLCNGQNGTRDLRGLVIAGATSMPGGDTMNDNVRPGVNGNPSYNNGEVQGTNTVTLNIGQMPSHSHTPTLTFNDPGHNHTTSTRYTHRADFANNELIIDTTQNSSADNPVNVSTTSNTKVTGITVAVSIADNGGGLPHPNNQPTIGINYITYRP